MLSELKSLPLLLFTSLGVKRGDTKGGDDARVDGVGSCKSKLINRGNTRTRTSCFFLLGFMPNSNISLD